LTGRALADEDSAMTAYRELVMRCAVLVAAASCRGEAKPPVAVPVDQPLAWPAVDEPALIALTATAGFERGAPVPLAITPDGAVIFRRSKPRERSADLYQLDPTGKVTLLAQAAALLGGAAGQAGAGQAAAGQAADGIDTIEVSDDGARILVPLAGRLFVIERATPAPRELAIGAHRDPALSPDGKRVAFVRDGDLWLQAIGEPQPTRLTQHPADRVYATPDADAADFGRRRGYEWSPDSQAIVFQRSDTRAMDTRYAEDAAHPEQAPVARKVAHPGRPIAVVDLGIVSIRGGAPRWVTWELARYPYLARVSWPASGPLTAIVVGRAQTQLAVLAIDPATGATRPLVVEKDPAWVELARDPLTWLPDGSGFLWATESHGSWALDLHAPDGALVRAIATADLGLRRVVGLAAEGRDVILEAAADPREQHVWRVPLAGGAPVALTKDGGVHRAWSGHGVLVIRSDRRAGGRTTIVVRSDGTRVELPALAEHPAAPATTFETVTIEDHAQHVAITRPRAFDAKVRYPVLLRVDGEPTHQPVRDALDDYALDQWYADAGFIVVRSDARGTPDRGRDWQRAISGDLLSLPMNDQIGALKQLGAPHPELDLHRVGIVGAGFGGSLAALGVMIHPDVFAAGAALAPITDWSRVGAALGERYMKSPIENPDGYRRASATTYAEQLTRPLLLVHGVADAPITFDHTLALLEALGAAGKRVELSTLPSDGDPLHDRARALLVLGFLRDHLGPPVRPAVMPTARTEEEEEEEERERERSHAKAPAPAPAPAPK
jgi:dipeptidyl-peptidase 4